MRFADSVINVSRGQSDVEDDSIGGSEDPQKIIARRKVLNLTTSFADGIIFTSILDECRPYLFEAVACNLSRERCQLDSRLR